MREKITFTAGKAVRTMLDQPEGKPVDGKNGPQYMRVCDNDQRIMFIEPELEEAIKQSGATAGDAIQITQIGKGRTAAWDVGIIADTRPIQPRPPAPSFRPPAAAAALAPPERQITGDAAQLTAAYVAAIEATAAAEAYASQHAIRDLHLADADTITRCALSIYIQRAKEDR
jgi:hypothetical protein